MLRVGASRSLAHDLIIAWWAGGRTGGEYAACGMVSDIYIPYDIHEDETQFTAHLDEGPHTQGIWSAVHAVTAAAAAADRTCLVWLNLD